MTDAVRTMAREDRNVSGPAVTFSIADELKRLREEPEWISGTRNSVTVVKTANLSVVLTAVKKDATLCGHEVDGPTRCRCFRARLSSEWPENRGRFGAVP